jgi:hypothetical protein
MDCEHGHYVQNCQWCDDVTELREKLAAAEKERDDARENLAGAMDGQVAAEKHAEAIEAELARLRLENEEAVTLLEEVRHRGTPLHPEVDVIGEWLYDRDRARPAPSREIVEARCVVDSKPCERDPVAFDRAKTFTLLAGIRSLAREGADLAKVTVKGGIKGLRWSDPIGDLGEIELTLEAPVKS